MWRLIARRLLVSVPLVVFVSLLTFVLQALTPGDTARAILGENYTPEAYTQLRHQLGLDRPMLVQYWQWLISALHGKLGVSQISGLSVGAEIANRLSVTMSLIVGATLVAALLGIALGVVSAIRPGKLGRVVDVLALAGFALPSFWLGLVLVTLFAVALRVFPATGYVPLAKSPSGWIVALVLPVVALAVHGMATVAKQTRDGMLTALSRDFVHVLRANGVSETSIILRHSLRNAALPVVTVIGVVFVSLLNGTVLIETVFAMPGLGGLAVQATTQHDVRMIQGVAVVFTLIVVVINLLVDIAYGWLNPKVRVQ
ncbi:ABC transporter permease [Amycolatopsis sp. NBC_01488]|uniref:ABC transporter permease n=1 Tax=Amycolatopsis sp. NBC_01488 TaxID=2903563 RepID=UPI002E2E5F2A|nr:ABC transporter permease [Amycolatopsis sp. NBC_01488]